MKGALHNKLNKVIAEALRISNDIIHPDLYYQSIREWDSLAHINLMLELEKNFGIIISDEEVVTLTSVEAIKDYVEAKLSKNVLRDKDGEKTNVGEKKIKRGLTNVFYDNTNITLIDPDRGRLLYVGYSLDSLISDATFEEVIYLLLYKSLPNKIELRNFKNILKGYQSLSLSTLKLITLLKEKKPIEVLQACITSLSTNKEEVEKDKISDLLKTGLQLIMQVPAIIAAHHAIRQNREPISPKNSFSFAENYLYMLKGNIPTMDEVLILNKDLILHADHCSNASTFTARIAASTNASIYSAINAAIAVFSGSLHGGALEKVLNLLDNVSSEEETRHFIKARISNNLPIYGFGHRVYRIEDPRAIHMRQMCKELSIKIGKKALFNKMEVIRNEMESYAKYGLHVNVDFYGAAIYSFLEIPEDVFVPTFVVSRVAGWVAHILEQASNNILIRPRLNYVGDKDKPYIPINQRRNFSNQSINEEIYFVQS